MRPGDLERDLERARLERVLRDRGHVRGERDDGLGQNVFVVGSIPALANWNTTTAIALSSAAYPVWRATVNLPAQHGVPVQVHQEGRARRSIWESDPNRARTTPTSPCAVTYTDTWR